MSNSNSQDELPAYHHRAPEDSSRGRYIIDPVKIGLYDPCGFSDNVHHPFRSRRHHDPLFKVPAKELVRDANSKSCAPGADELQTTQEDFQVESCTLEYLISAARVSAYLSVIRLGHRERFFPHATAPLNPNEMRSFWIREDPGRLVQFGADNHLMLNFTYEGCLETCRSATEATVQVLQKALQNYEKDPDILWSLWCHQSIPFHAYSSEVLGVLNKWLDAFQPALPFQSGSISSSSEEKKMETARGGYYNRVEQPVTGTKDPVSILLSHNLKTALAADITKGH
ncbi:hypothetical protein TWF694_001405 [Orbilia ellipsospora]|uniref:Uncharacterized protein n=1 Tax=Orbilia ellipsospora TaxID=2528407 RepID=A0AAV9XRL0_9PEZI